MTIFGPLLVFKEGVNMSNNNSPQDLGIGIIGLIVILGILLLCFNSIKPAGWMIFYDSEKKNIDLEKTNYVSCDGYKLDKKSNKDRVENILYKFKWKVVREELASTTGDLTGIKKISCDRLSKIDERVRIDYIYCGARCSLTSYWIEAGGKEALFINYATDNIDVAQSVINNDGSAMFSIDDSSLAYFKLGEFFTPFSETIYLPINICFRDEKFYDCTKAYSNISTKISYVSDLIDTSLKSKRSTLSDTQFNIMRKMIEYVALCVLDNNDDYKLQLKTWGLSDDNINSIAREVFRRLATRNNNYGIVAVSLNNLAALYNAESNNAK